MRLDRFLSRWFPKRSRAALSLHCKNGLITDFEGTALRPAYRLKGTEVLRILVPGIAPTTPPPPLPEILFENDHLAVLNKPAGLICHPAGGDHQYAVIGLARERWPKVDLAHRIDKETSGVLVVSKDAETNIAIKAAFKAGSVSKKYLAISRGPVAWDQQVVDAPIGADGGDIRIKMAVRTDGLPAKSTFQVIKRANDRALIEAKISTGRTHQIRVHLDHLEASLLGDKLYGVPSSVFLEAWEQGVTESVVRAAGAPRHALHAAEISFSFKGETITTTAPLPDDMQRWWTTPTCLPLDGWTTHSR